MAKARSKRTTRNRKSRNRRGGMFGFFRSSVIDEFKEKLEKVPKIKDILDDCRKSENVNKCFSYPITDEELIDSIESILKTSDPHVTELKKYIKEKTNNEGDKKAFMDAISEGKKRGVYLFVANYVIDEPQEHKGTKPDNIKPHSDDDDDDDDDYEDYDTARELREAAGISTLGDLNAIIEEKDKQAKAYEKYKKDIDIEKQKTGDSSQPKGGGKSRRRHRRGRTLHKRRKSRKVRKTGCRRK